MIKCIILIIIVEKDSPVDVGVLLVLTLLRYWIYADQTSGGGERVLP